MLVVAALFSLSITVAAFGAEESNRVYLLCDETIAKADSSPEVPLSRLHSRLCGPCNLSGGSLSRTHCGVSDAGRDYMGAPRK